MSARRTVSFSGMSLYENCPSAYERRYITNEQLPPRPPNAKSERGTKAHSDVEKYLNGDLCEVPAVAWRYKKLLEALRDCREVTSEREFGCTEQWEEVPFDDPDAMVRGKLDADYEHEDVIHVFEWKTGKWYAEHARQRSLYSTAALTLYPHLNDVHIQTVYFDLGKIESQDLSRTYVKAHQRVWQQRADAVQPPQVYPQTPNWKCKGKTKWCDYHVKNGGTCNGKET